MRVIRLLPGQCAVALAGPPRYGRDLHGLYRTADKVRALAARIVCNGIVECV